MIIQQQRHDILLVSKSSEASFPTRYGLLISCVTQNHLRSNPLLQLCISDSTSIVSENVTGNFYEMVVIAAIVASSTFNTLFKRSPLKQPYREFLSHHIPAATGTMFLRTISPNTGMIRTIHGYAQSEKQKKQKTISLQKYFLLIISYVIYSSMSQ